MTLADTGTGPRADDAHRALDRALQGLEGKRPWRISVPAPAVDAERAFRPLADGPVVLFQGRDGLELAGWGAARDLRAQGPDRFRAIAAEGSAFLSGIAPADESRGDEPLPEDLVTPRAFGGLAFAPGAADAAPWAGFGDARFVVPRWTYARRGPIAALTLVLGGDEDPAGALAEAEPLLRALETAPSEAPAPALVTVEDLPRSAWARRVDAILAAIGAGDFEKIVAARRSTVAVDGPLDPAAALRRLRAAYGTCTRLGFMAPEGPTFLGATPERLVSVRGLRLETEALAGTRSAALDPEALLASAKDVAEHAPVVRRIRERLGPHCDRIGVADAPELRRLPNVVHIRTAIEGALRAPTHVLALAEALHPTPAVGGVPEAGAIRWIGAHEEHPRGWYAAPFGWFDAAGQGELVVSLRSGLLDGDRAHLFAGGGIVDGSTPDAEWEETALKLRPMREALGLPTA